MPDFSDLLSQIPLYAGFFRHQTYVFSCQCRVFPASWSIFCFYCRNYPASRVICLSYCRIFPASWHIYSSQCRNFPASRIVSSFLMPGFSGVLSHILFSLPEFSDVKINFVLPTAGFFRRLCRNFPVPKRSLSLLVPGFSDVLKLFLSFQLIMIILMFGTFH